MQQFFGVFIVVAFIIWVSGFVIFSIKTNKSQKARNLNLSKSNSSKNKLSTNKLSNKTATKYDASFSEYDDSSFFACLKSFLAIRKKLKNSSSMLNRAVNSNSVFTAKQRQPQISQQRFQQKTNGRQIQRQPQMQPRMQTQTPTQRQTQGRTRGLTRGILQNQILKNSSQNSWQNSNHKVQRDLNQIPIPSKSSELFKESADLTLAKAKMQNVSQEVANFNPHSGKIRVVSKNKYAAEFARANDMINKLDLKLKEFEQSDPRKLREQKANTDLNNLRFNSIRKNSSTLLQNEKLDAIIDNIGKKSASNML